VKTVRLQREGRLARLGAAAPLAEPRLAAGLELAAVHTGDEGGAQEYHYCSPHCGLKMRRGELLTLVKWGSLSICKLSEKMVNINLLSVKMRIFFSNELHFDKETNPTLLKILFPTVTSKDSHHLFCILP
jgi:hypothetical protein